MEFTAALCARLCHDMATPIGALAGAIELAEEDASEAAESLKLAGDMVRELVARLRLLRAAWAGECGALTRTELCRLSLGLNRRVQVDLGALHDGPFEEAVSRLLLNLLLLGAEMLPRGGSVALAGASEEAITLSVSGPSIRWDAEAGVALRDPASLSAYDPRSIQAPFTAWLARDCRMAFSFLLPAGPGLAPVLLLTRG